MKMINFDLQKDSKALEAFDRAHELAALHGIAFISVSCDGKIKVVNPQEITINFVDKDKQ